MVEIPISKFADRCNDNKYMCYLEANDEFEVRRVKRIAFEHNCTGFANYKDCTRHVFVIRVMFNATEKKEAFIKVLKDCAGIQVCTKTKYA